MTGVVVEMGLLIPCPDMRDAHDAVDRGEHTAAAGHYLAAARAAYAAAGGGEEGRKWAAIGDLRVAWAGRAARHGAAR